MRNTDAGEMKRVDRDLDAMRRGPVAQVWEKVQQLWQFIRDPDAPKGAKLLALGALIYLVTPIDLVPDIVPIAGLADDVSVILATVAKLADYLRRYEEARYEEAQRRLSLRQMKMKRRIWIGTAGLLVVVGVILLLLL